MPPFAGRPICRVEDGRGSKPFGQPRLPSPLIKPDVRICRVAQPLLAFAPTEPTVRRYRSGLFRADLRRIDHLCQACWITGSGSGKAVRSFVVGCPGHTAFLAAFAEHLVTRFG